MTSAIRLDRWLPVSLLILGVGSSAGQAAPPKKTADEREVKLPALLSAKPLKEDRKDDAMRKLLKARYNEAVSEAREYYRQVKKAREGRGSFQYDADHFYGMWRRVVQAGLELCDKPAEKVALLTHYLAVTKEAERRTQSRYDAGEMKITALRRARHERLDAEVRLLRAKREADRAKDK